MMADDDGGDDAMHGQQTKPITPRQSEESLNKMEYGFARGSPAKETSEAQSRSARQDERRVMVVRQV